MIPERRMQLDSDFVDRLLAFVVPWAIARDPSLRASFDQHVGFSADSYDGIGALAFDIGSHVLTDALMSSVLKASMADPVVQAIMDEQEDTSPKSAVFRRLCLLLGEAVRLRPDWPAIRAAIDRNARRRRTVERVLGS